jgi:hypothetical protein
MAAANRLEVTTKVLLGPVAVLCTSVSPECTITTAPTRCHNRQAFLGTGLDTNPLKTGLTGSIPLAGTVSARENPSRHNRSVQAQLEHRLVRLDLGVVDQHIVF